MPLDPAVRTLLDELAAAGGPPLETLPVADARELARQLATLQRPAEAVARIENRRIPGPGLRALRTCGLGSIAASSAASREDRLAAERPNA